MSRLDLVERLVRIPSVSESEGAIADAVADELSTFSHLSVTRIGDNVIAHPHVGETVVLLVAHLDTVPGDVSEVRRDGDTLTGVGACDTKGSVAGLLELAATKWPVPVTYVFYAREEIARARSGLLEIHDVRPDLLSARVAVVGEPTLGAVEAGCQGSLRVRVTLRGVRAHTSRPFMGVNAIHRLTSVLERVADWVPRSVTLDGVEFTEQLQVVRVEGGVANNVVPDLATLVVNFRFAPDRSDEDAVSWLRDFLGDTLAPSDRFEVDDLAPAARPHLSHPDVADLVHVSGTPARAKVGWTDVATLSAWGVPSVNVGAGDPLLAHSPEECLRESEMTDYVTTLREWLESRR